MGSMRADFYIAADSNDPGDRVILRSTLLVEGLRRGLISASALTNDGYALSFEAKRCVLSKNSRALITIQRQDANLYELNRGLLSDLTPSQPAPPDIEEAHLARTYSVGRALPSISLAPSVCNPRLDTNISACSST